MTSFDLTGRKAMVTGGTRGLGLGMAEALAEAGADVVIFGTSAKVHDVAADLAGKGFKVQGTVCDLSDADGRQAGFADALAKLGGGIDILVNAAGIQKRHKAEDFPLSDFAEVMEVNLTAVFDFCQLAGRIMLEQGQDRKSVV